MTEKFDLILPVGQACSCSQSLRTAGLQFASFPWDWIATRDIRKCIESDCSCGKDFMRKEELVRLEPRGDHPMDFYRNTRINICYNHDFPRGVPLDESFPAVAAKYERRFARQDRLIRGARKPVLLLRIDSPIIGPTSLDECRYARRRMAESFPGKVFEICLFSLDRDRPFEDRIEEEVEPGFLHVVFDYSDKTPGAAEYNVNQNAIAQVLRRHFSVRDYRTHEEKKAFVEKVRAEKYANAGVSTALGYRLYRLKTRLLKLLGRR
jgi:hypothetical protein